MTRAILRCADATYVCRDDAEEAEEGEGGDDGAWCATGRPRCAFPSTAVLGLVWGVYEARRERAYEALRGHIEVNGVLTDACRAVVKVGAKRFASQGATVPAETGEVRVLPPWPRTEEPFFGTSVPARVDRPAPRTAESAAVSSLLRYVAERDGDAPAVPGTLLWERDRQVSALLVDATGAPLLAARNRNARNKIRHAEMNLVLGWWERHGGPFPAGARLYVTLQPCRMCAAFLVRAQRDAGARPVPVRYLDPDPGPLARHTALDDERDEHGHSLSERIDQTARAAASRVETGT